MEALFLLVPLSIGIVFLAIRVFFGMSDSGQFDDMVGPAWRILQDDDRTVKTEKITTNEIAHPTRKAETNVD